MPNVLKLPGTGLLDGVIFSRQLILLRKLLLICLQELKRLVKMKYSYCASHSTICLTANRNWVTYGLKADKIISWWFPLEHIKLFLKARVVGLKFTFWYRLHPGLMIHSCVLHSHCLVCRTSYINCLRGSPNANASKGIKYECVFPPIFTGTWPSYFT